MKLIDKDTLIAEIDKCYNESRKMGKTIVSDYWNGKSAAYRYILMFLDTLELKEVDLDKMLTKFMSRYAYENGGEYPSAIDIAKHFFELGIKTIGDLVRYGGREMRKDKNIGIKTAAIISDTLQEHFGIDNWFSKESEL